MSDNDYGIAYRAADIAGGFQGLTSDLETSHAIAGGAFAKGIEDFQTLVQSSPAASLFVAGIPAGKEIRDLTSSGEPARQAAFSPVGGPTIPNSPHGRGFSSTSKYTPG